MTSTILISNCGEKKESDSQLQIQFGSNIPTTQYPAVVDVDIDGTRCSGTFIKHNILLTAAHCVKDSSRIIVNGRYALTSLFHSDFREGSATYDIALVKFPENTAPATMNIYTYGANQGDDVTLIGFGRDENDAGSGVKRIGYNTVYSVDDTYVIYEGRHNFPGNGAITNRGDSGGPLLVEGKGIVGVVSLGGTWLFSDYSEYANLNSASSRRFFAEAKDKGFM